MAVLNNPSYSLFSESPLFSTIAKTIRYVGGKAQQPATIFLTFIITQTGKTF